MTEIDPLVSVVIPAYNAQDHLAECLASVRGQLSDYTMEIIVVDDGSQDATAQIAQQQPGVQCIIQPNKGPSAARNVGISAAKGKFVAFLDADDLWPPGKLAAQVRILQQHPEVALIFGDCRQFDSQGPRPQTEFQANQLGSAAWGTAPLVPDAYARLLEVNFITTGSVVARHSALKAVGGFAEDLRLVEDLDLWLRIARHHPIAWCDQECLHRRRHTSNISRDVDAMGLAYLEVLRRHRLSWSAEEITLMRLDAGLLVATKYLYLAERSMAQGHLRAATRQVWEGFSASPRPLTLWRIARLIVKLMVGRHG